MLLGVVRFVWFWGMGFGLLSGLALAEERVEVVVDAAVREGQSSASLGSSVAQIAAAASSVLGGLGPEEPGAEVPTHRSAVGKPFWSECWLAVSVIEG